MNAITINPGLEKDAAAWAKRQGLTLDAFVEQAIERLIEDMADIAAADEALRSYDPGKNLSLQKVRQDLGLDN